MYPAFIAAAFFTGILLNDVLQKVAPMELGKHFLFGFLAVLGLWAIEARGMPIVAWGLLVVPTAVLSTSLVYVFLSPAAPVAPVVAPMPIPKPIPPAPKEVPEETPIQLPDENTVCVDLDFSDAANTKPALPSCDIGADGTIGMPGTVKPVTPSCPTNLSQTTGSASATTAATTTAPSATQTLDDLLKSMNKSLTPVTVCEAGAA
jgi:hypothetical protein